MDQACREIQCLNGEAGAKAPAAPQAGASPGESAPPGTWFSRWRPRKQSFSHGIHPAEHKEQTAGKSVRRLPFPPRMIIPLSQHIGAPCIPLVHEGQEVVRGEPIARAGGFVSVPMHAPATGIVEKIGLAQTVTGVMAPAIFLRLYPGAGQEVLYGAPVEIDTMAPEALVRAVQDTGVVGLGGAGFPTHVKMVVPEGKHVDTIIVNGCECEPYLTTDHRLMLEQPEHIYDGIRVALRAVGAKQAIIGVECNKMDAVERLRAVQPPDLPVRVEAVETKYPQGAEKMLIKSLLDREVPPGGLPVDVHVAVYNVATLAQIGELLPRQQGLIERVVTVSGPAVKQPGNYLMPLGTPLQFVLDQVGLTGSSHRIIFGGPMMGMAVSSMDSPITKGVTGILVFFDKVEEKAERVFPCIRCGACVDACPIHLNPAALGTLARKRGYETMADDYHLMDCFECGCCSFVCPSNIPLVQQFRVAKAVLRERKAAT